MGVSKALPRNNLASHNVTETTSIEHNMPTGSTTSATLSNAVFPYFVGYSKLRSCSAVTSASSGIVSCGSKQVTSVGIVCFNPDKVVSRFISAAPRNRGLDKCRCVAICGLDYKCTGKDGDETMRALGIIPDADFEEHRRRQFTLSPGCYIDRARVLSYGEIHVNLWLCLDEWTYA